MSTVVKTEPRIESIEVTDRAIVVVLRDGRIVTLPLTWSWRLEQATPTERANHRIAHDGSAVHWPDVEEDLSALGMLTGSPAPRPKSKTRPRATRGRPASAAKRSSIRAKRARSR